ncbi:TonB-dependent receptor [Galbibacter sp. EGI 63066]|uniref:SusC/RagA family TonB-linked outer membrane protein n=1 Tax=Galbibacter sp. EGI 63066 TaxID=2993559 RepID=UPI002249539D|nr:TonB-dependent receptor [Galbibacter sp. EGI 63066]MCX2680478.1 TonB-dependent receptor [Galbibacter sp. EGI 63066]
MSKIKLFGIVLFFGLLQSAWAQTKTVTGMVVDQEGAPIPGANVLIKGTAQGTSTDFDGNYTINSINEDAILVFSFVGFVSKEVAVTGKSTIDVVLEEDFEQLGEVVVVAYGTSTKKDLTGAVGIVKSDDINSFPANNVEQALQGKTSGVQVTQNSGAPGASVSVSIRGTGSFGNTAPLYVVDGFPTQDISFLNPNDIQTISVLKDASASALYGVRASNGVVIIQTKEGTPNKLSVSVDSWTGIRTAPKNIDVLNAQQFAEFASELGTSQGKEIMDEWSNPNALTNVNWQDYAFNDAFRMGHSVSVLGGSDKLRAAFSAGLLEEDGVVVASSFKRYNVGMNVSYDLSEKFRAKANLKYTYSESYQNLGQGYYNLNKVFANVPYLDDRTGTNLPYDGQGNYGAFTDSGLISQSVNVLAQALQQDNDNSRNVVLGNFSVEYDFIKDFTAKVNFGFNSQNFAGWNFVPTFDRGSSNNDQNPTAQYNISQNTSNEYVLEGLLEYNKEIGKHTVGVLVGASSQQNKYKNVFVDSRGFLNNDIRDLSQAETISDQSGTWGTSTLASTFARLNYNFDQKYYITATVRRDGNGDRFGKNNLYGVFPSFALGWNIDEESFMQDSPFDVLKLRGSWGETGSFLGIAPFQYLAYYNNGSAADDAGYVFGNTPVQGVQPVSLANPDLKWETQVQTDIGVEGELLDRHLYFTADWFRREAKDFLIDLPIPSQTGFTSKAVNGGNVVNQGWELLVGYRKMEGDFKWDVSANFTTVDNEVTALVEDLEYKTESFEFVPDFVDDWLGFTRSYVGGNVGTFYGYRVDGIFQTQAEIDALNSSAPEGVYQSAETAPGDRKFKDLNGDGVVNGDDREVIGSPIPDFYGGLNFTGSYKNFELMLDFYGTYGNEILNFVRNELERAGGYGLDNAYTNIGVDYYNNRWTPENPSSTYARAVVSDPNKNNRVSDHFVEDGSYLRLRNLRIGYNLPSTVVDAIGMSSAKIYVSGQNLITWTDYSGWDPEIGQVADVNGNSSVQTRGVDFGAYPITKSFTLGVNLQF